jgi:hypothetical protein
MDFLLYSLVAYMSRRSGHKTRHNTLWSCKPMTQQNKTPISKNEYCTKHNKTLDFVCNMHKTRQNTSFVKETRGIKYSFDKSDLLKEI